MDDKNGLAISRQIEMNPSNMSSCCSLVTQCKRLAFLLACIDTAEKYHWCSCSYQYTLENTKIYGAFLTLYGTLAFGIQTKFISHWMLLASMLITDGHRQMGRSIKTKQSLCLPRYPWLDNLAVWFIQSNVYAHAACSFQYDVVLEIRVQFHMVDLWKEHILIDQECLPSSWAMCEPL